MTPPAIATLTLESSTTLQCVICQEIDRLTVTLGVALAVPVLRVACTSHGVIAQFPLAPHALAYYVPPAREDTA